MCSQKWCAHYVYYMLGHAGMMIQRIVDLYRKNVCSYDFHIWDHTCDEVKVHSSPDTFSAFSYGLQVQVICHSFSSRHILAEQIIKWIRKDPQRLVCRWTSNCGTTLSRLIHRLSSVKKAYQIKRHSIRYKTIKQRGPHRQPAKCKNQFR